MDEQQNIRIARYLAGDATEQEREELRTELARSKALREDFFRLKNLWEAAHPAFDPKRIDTDAALRKVLAKRTQPPQAAAPRPTLTDRFRHIAAVLFIPLLTASLFFAWKAANRTGETIAFNEVTAPYGTMTRIVLPDSSRVWINTGSSLEYPSHFRAGEQRTVRMTGEAYFEVHADEKRPFVVEVGGLNVTAKGTAFNINAYDKLRETVVTLVSGKVDVAAGGVKNSLLPEQQLSYYADGTMRITDVDTFRGTSWKDGILAFRDDALKDVFNHLGQIYRVQFEVMDPELGDYVYRATFRGETFDQILRLLEISAPIRFEEQPRHQESDSGFSEKIIRVYKNQ